MGLSTDTVELVPVGLSAKFVWECTENLVNRFCCLAPYGIPDENCLCVHLCLE